MELELLLISNVHKRNFSKALTRIQPALLDLKDRFAAVPLTESLTRVVAILSTSPTTSFCQHYEGLTSRFSFAAGFGKDWRFHVSEDMAVLTAIGHAIVTALERSNLSPAGQSAISELVEMWIRSLPAHCERIGPK